jgi:hypothetical protein
MQSPRDLAIPVLESLSMPMLCADGYMRCTVPELHALNLIHLHTAVDEDDIDLPDRTHGSIPALVHGYTEWINDTQPTVSLGWDWCLEWQDGRASCQLLNTPRTNLMIINEQGHDLGDRHTLQLLADYIRQFDWSAAVIDATLQHYASGLPSS